MSRKRKEEKRSHELDSARDELVRLLRIHNELVRLDAPPGT